MSELRDLLYALRNGGSRYGLERMARLVEAMGHPEKQFRSIHVAGTNGKGSVCAMLAAVYQQAGRRTGLFTSPHLVDLGERVRVDGALLDADAFLVGSRVIARAVLDHGLVEDDWHPTFFEWMTALGFWQFARQRVDIAVVETGLGGRLDATNVLVPEISVITSIGLDHTEILGETESLIAAEKGGIIKPGVPVVVGLMQSDPEAVLRRLAWERGSPFFSVREACDPETLPECSWPGGYQRRNQATAEQVGRVVPDPGLRFSPDSLRNALSRALWRGRWETLQVDGRTVIIDATHNVEGAVFLAQQIEELKKNTSGEIFAVLGSTAMDRARALLAAVRPGINRGVLVTFPQPRALAPGVLQDLLEPGERVNWPCGMLEEIFPGPGICRLGNPGDTILVSGSVYLAGEVLSRLRGVPGDGALQG